MNITFALIGNPNSGKTALFNQLTGSNQHVGNFPGVTVEKKSGTIRRHRQAEVVDLPGIYSLSPYSPEEVITRDYIFQAKPDGIINIVDGTNIERNLYLSLQLIELGVPMIIALNMMDEVRASGHSIDTIKLQEELGVPVVPISAIRNEGVDELIDLAIRTAEQKTTPKRLDFCTGPVHTAIHAMAHIVEEKAKKAGVSSRFAATKLVEGDDLLADTLGLSENEKDIIGHVVDDMEKALELDREAALADMRYTFIEQLTSGTVTKNTDTKAQERSLAIDRIFTHRIFAIPIFIAIMFAVFWLTFDVFGVTLSDMFAEFIDSIIGMIDVALGNAGVNEVLHSLLIDGVFSGVGSVLGFLPTILLLFFFLSILEDTGYLARVAFVMDRLLRRIGLSGRSIVPLLIGYGCTVPAVMATRTLASERDRKMTILLTPFMSCSAKLPVYALFIPIFFPHSGGLAMTALYFTGILVAIITGLIFKNTLFKGEPVPFVMELPAYRFPSARSVGMHMWQKAQGFVLRAFTIIFVATVGIWLLQSFDTQFNMVEDAADSMLAALGQTIAPIFAPLGFGDWIASTALFTGLMAKEAIISTFSVLVGVEEEGLGEALRTMYTSLQAFSLLTFFNLYMPCVAAMAAMKKEFDSLAKAALAMLYVTVVAWIVAFIVYNVGGALGF